MKTLRFMLLKERTIEWTLALTDQLQLYNLVITHLLHAEIELLAISMSSRST